MNDQKTYTIELDEGDLGLVGRALAEMPYKVAAPLIAKIGGQVDAAASGAKQAQDGDAAAEPWKK